MSEMETLDIDSMSLDERVERVVSELQTILANVPLKSSFLADVAAVFEKHSRSMALVYIESKKRGEGETAGEVAGDAVQKAVKLLQQYKIPRAESIFLIKKLEAVQSYKSE